MKLFIVVPVAITRTAERRAVRETWLPRILPSQKLVFVAGRGPAISEPDLVQLDVLEDRDGLWDKVRGAFVYSLQFEWDYLFKCDDDTYVVPERLEGAFRAATLAPRYPLRPGGTRERVGDEPEYIGADCPITVPSLYAMGGAGYFLSRRLVKEIAECQDYVPCPYDWWGEDGWVGVHARRSTRLYLSPYLQYDKEPFPLPDNQIATCHWMRPPEMYAAHRRFLGL